MMTPRGSVVVALLTLSVVARLVPYALSTLGMSIDPATTTYPWNFSPILPICIFGGAMYARWRLAYLIPLATFLLGDVGIWAPGAFKDAVSKYKDALAKAESA